VFDAQIVVGERRGVPVARRRGVKERLDVPAAHHRYLLGDRQVGLR
jgi:hypothetical protein